MKSRLNRLMTALNVRGYKGVALWFIKRLEYFLRQKYQWLARTVGLHIRVWMRSYLPFKQWRKLEQNLETLGYSKSEYRNLKSHLTKSFIGAHYRLLLDEKPPRVDSQTLFVHYLENSLERGMSPNPMFDAKLVGRALDLEIEIGFMEWFLRYRDKVPIPTRLFDQHYYAAISCPEACGLEGGYLHYVEYGWFKDLNPNPGFDANWYREFYSIAEPGLGSFYDYLLAKESRRPSKGFPYQPATSNQTNRAWMDALLASPKFIEKIGAVPREHPDTLDPLIFLKEELRKNLKYQTYHSIVLIPRCGLGGAGLVAGKLVSSLKRIRVDESVLVLLTDDPMLLRPDWFADADQVIALDELCSVLDFDAKARLLNYVFEVVSAERIFNVNSFLAWEMLVRKPALFGAHLKIFAYGFCYELNHLGDKTGFPISHLPICIERLDAMLVDNSFLAEDLVAQNRWPQEIGDKIQVFHTPKEESEDTVPAFEWRPPEKTDDKPIIFWAGRFDRQKRLDIVRAIARNNPQWEFWIWGKAMLGREPDFQRMPANMKFHGVFETLDDLPLKQCHVWLYTSQWDGVPTILIELGARGVPVVASRVWGTSDIINSQSAWPVDAIESPAAYEVKIKEALRNGAIAKNKGQSLKALVEEQHSLSRYDTQLNLLLNCR